MHEMGHTLGFADVDGSQHPEALMSLQLMPEQARRLPTGPLLTSHNPVQPYDVNGDGHITALDALQLINQINLSGSALTAVAPGVAPLYYDVTGDGTLSALDVLQVVNYLEQHVMVSSGEGEGANLETSSPRDASLSANHVDLSAILPSAGLVEGETPLDRPVESLPASSAPLATISTLSAPSRTVVSVAILELANRQEEDLEDILSTIAKDVAAVWRGKPR
ncbi:MAG: dockerin type I domain-containing protein [Planctomycetota bacterium]|nr:dockerin type I domain-containing protein [Planctomycetota bacterium]